MPIPVDKTLDFKNHVADMIEKCLVNEGVPTFKTRYAGERFGKGVLFVCYGKSDKIPHVWFNDVPEEDIEFMENNVGEWKYLLRKYGSEKQKKLADEYVIKATRKFVVLKKHEE
ncbi:MAG: hypothetical protein DRN95_03630 [Candidatus Hydrothermarchaeota archaeon]|nr:MAG: hypothetical protein DRN95_03630 [Candidatus Hydrothermarchaeota archaeon]